MKKMVSNVLIFSLMFSGCSSFRSPTQMVSVTTDQPDAQIYINGNMTGKGAATASVRRNENVQIMAKKAGYVTTQRAIGHSLNTTGVLDIVGGVLILVPLLGLLAAGSHNIDENNVSITMVKE